MNSFKYISQSLLEDLLKIKSKNGDPEALFNLGKILWGRQQFSVAKLCLDEASKRGQIEAEQFLNHNSNCWC